MSNNIIKEVLLNPKYTLSYDEDAHRYMIDGEHVLSVTQVLKYANKPALISWASNCCAKYIETFVKNGDTVHPGNVESVCAFAAKAYDMESKDAMSHGSDIHGYIEEWFKGKISEAQDKDLEQHPAWVGFKNWLACNKVEPYLIEHKIGHKSHRYAGTVDFIGKIGGNLCVCDFKTSKGIYEEYMMQLSAYHEAIFENNTSRYFDDELSGVCVRFDKKTGEFEDRWYPESSMVSVYHDVFLPLLEFANGYERLFGKKKSRTIK